MKLRATILVLSGFLLWVSVSVGPYHSKHSDRNEITMDSGLASMFLSSGKDFFKKKLLQSTTTPVAFTVMGLSLWAQSPRVIAYFIQGSIKYYLLFRVLRD